MPDTNDKFRKSEDISKQTRRNVFYRPITFFLIIVSIIFIMGIFFEISVIDVEGNVNYSADEIISASGIHTGDNLFFLNRIGAGSRIVVKLPYIESVSITRHLPNSITISVSESKATACIAVGEELWSISSSGKFLGAIDEKDAELLARIEGLTADSAAVGDTIAVPEDSRAKLDYLLDILYQIQARGIVSKVSDIDLSDADNPIMEYDSRFTVKLGARDDTEYKFGKLLSAVEQLSVDDSGTMDLSDSNKVNFSPN